MASFSFVPTFSSSSSSMLQERAIAHSSSSFLHSSVLSARRGGFEGSIGKSVKTPPPSFVTCKPRQRQRERVSPPQCQASSDKVFLPDADFYKVEAILRPWRLQQVTTGLLRAGIRGVTVVDVKGFGSQGGSRERQAGSEFSEDGFVSKVKLEVVVSREQVNAVIDCIIDEARTGEIGDGKIFVIPVADVIRVRTGERGWEAERMAGGRSDLLSSLNGGSAPN